MQNSSFDEIDFAAAGELTVVHVPTGTRYSTYAASNPDEFYVLRQGPAGTSGLCDKARPILEQMLRRQRRITAVEVRR